MTTIEKNKLIAEFMGYKYMKWIDVEAYQIPFKSNVNVIPELLEFHSSWDWLMPVVVKCFDVYDFTEELNSNHQFRLNDALIAINLEHLYDVVVEFIIWYNQNKRNNMESFGDFWSQLTEEQQEYLSKYIDRQRESAIEEYKKQLT